MTKFLTAKWENLVMANYAVDPSVLTPWLPAGVELDYYEGKTYVSLVGFLFRQTKIFRVPVPGFGTFEEVNLRFYVTRKTGSAIHRGVVFINETVPYKIVALLANRLYKENYKAVPTKHLWLFEAESKKIIYQWKVNRQWNRIAIEAALEKKSMVKDGFEAFIFEHYYGYTKVNETQSQEYRVFHPEWEINEVLDYEIKCDFKKMYGDEFEFLNAQAPDNVLFAEGSAVSIAWKRETF